MFVVPLQGDSVQTEGGVKHTVLSYAAYKDQPAVYVESEGASVKTVPFSDIKTINGTPVTLTPGKVFRVNSLVKRKAQLPQTGDKIVGGTGGLKVKSLKLRERGKLTNGLLLVCENLDTQEQTIARLADVERITRASGDSESTRTLLVTYKDYLGRQKSF